MKTWLDFYDYYLTDLPGCTYFAAANAIRQAAQEFCARSHAWRVTMDPTITIAGISSYEFDIDRTQEIVKVLSAKLGGQDFPVLLYEVDESDRGILVLNQREFAVQPTPDADLELVLKVIMKPSNTALGVEDFLYAAYAESIAYGAKYRLMEAFDKPYSNPRGAIANKQRFDDAIGSARVKAAKSYSSAPLRTRASFL